MLIGSMIKKLRVERNMTQEQLAECLGVSTNAVSQWERDVTAPDISNIPILANIFEVSADILFGIDIAKSKKAAEIEKFIEKEKELHSLGKTDARIELCREMRKKYPKARKYPPLVNCFFSQKRYCRPTRYLAICRFFIALSQAFIKLIQTHLTQAQTL